MYDSPVYTISKKHGKAVFYSLANNKYSYAHTEADESNDPVRDGIYILDMKSGKAELLIRNKDISSTIGINEIGYPDYCVFDPEGEKFFFLYRWDDKDGGYHTCIGVSDLEGNFKTLYDSVFISHAGWRGLNEVTAWGRLKEGLSKAQDSSFLKKTGIWKIAVGVFHGLVRNQSIRNRITNDAYLRFGIDEGGISVKLKKKSLWKMDMRHGQRTAGGC